MRGLIAVVGALLYLLGPVGTAAADEQYPTRAVQMIVPYPPSGALDTLARIVSAALSDELHQPVVVVNKAGGATVAGSVYVAHSAPDGYTLLFGAAPLALNVALDVKQPFDPFKDLTPISLVATITGLFAVAPSSPFKTLTDVINAAKSNDKGVLYATPGVGSSPHLIAEALKQEAKVNLVHSPYKGSAAALVGTMGGEVPLLVDVYIPTGAAVKQGQVRAIAVAAKQRLALLPDVPTTAEAGYPDIIGEAFFGMLAPAGTPAAIVERLHEAVVKVCAKDEVKKRLLDLGYNIVTSTPAEYSAYLHEQIDRYTPVVKAAGIKIE
jgi:tripartite-type tricarboxylate transporter receptor subunit TctC